MRIDDIKFDFDDILLKTADVSEIEHRSEINVYYDNEFLPLFTAPMIDVSNVENYQLFRNERINSIIPRGGGFNIIEYIRTSIIKDENILNILENNFIAVSLNDFELLINRLKGRVYRFPIQPLKILIDMANGHMKKLHDLIKICKKEFGNNIIIMAGNIGSPEAYKILSEAGTDYIRAGIGNGNGCITTQQTGIGYPMGSLIKECYDISCTMSNPAKIIADGGMKKYSDIIKSFALGSDFVMLGSIFNQALESAGETYSENKTHSTWKEPGEKVNQYNEQTKLLFNYGSKFYKKYRGMSTKEVQKELNSDRLKTSEGIVKIQSVEYTISKWTENFIDYLRSAMSYCGVKTLKDFIGKTDYMFISDNSLKRFSK